MPSEELTAIAAIAHHRLETEDILTRSAIDLTPTAAGLFYTSPKELHVTPDFLKAWESDFTVKTKTLAIAVMVGVQQSQNHPAFQVASHENGLATATLATGEQLVFTRSDNNEIIWAGII